MTEINTLKSPLDAIWEALCTRCKPSNSDACTVVYVKPEDLSEALKSDPLRLLLGSDIDQWLTVEEKRTLDELIKKIAFGRFNLTPAFDYAKAEFYD